MRVTGSKTYSHNNFSSYYLVPSYKVKMLLIRSVKVIFISIMLLVEFYLIP